VALAGLLARDADVYRSEGKKPFAKAFVHTEIQAEGQAVTSKTTSMVKIFGEANVAALEAVATKEGDPICVLGMLQRLPKGKKPNGNGTAKAKNGAGDGAEGKSDEFEDCIVINEDFGGEIKLPDGVTKAAAKRTPAPPARAGARR
jgi:hypothetical protein